MRFLLQSGQIAQGVQKHQTPVREKEHGRQTMVWMDKVEKTMFTLRWLRGTFSMGLWNTPEGSTSRTTYLVNLEPRLLQLFILNICFNSVSSSITQTVLLLTPGAGDRALHFRVMRNQGHHRSLEGDGFVNWRRSQGLVRDRRWRWTGLAFQHNLRFYCSRQVCFLLQAGWRGFPFLFEKLCCIFLGKLGSSTHTPKGLYRGWRTRGKACVDMFLCLLPT